MLVEALRYLTQIAVGRLESDKKLKSILEEEKQRINSTLEEMGLAKLGIEADEVAILKRILLKRALYGVDIQPFAAELAKLSLWIETFVFGTPLSFIEHHLKTGNALAWRPMARARKALDAGQGNPLARSISQKFRQLADVFRKLNALRDTTAADVTESKNIYRKEIKPMLDETKNYLDLMNAADILLAGSATDKALADKIKSPVAAADKARKAAFQKSAAEKKERGKALLELYEVRAQELADRTGAWEETLQLIREKRERRGFFNWSLEFPEVFASPDDKGFHIIIGNPPWDKTKFSDPDFFSQYRSNYRSADNAGKDRIAAELLAKPFIRERYEKQGYNIRVINEYYKERFPLSRGAGDGSKIKTPKIADLTRRENDLIVTKLYGLNLRDLEIILNTFKVMNEKYPGYGAALLESMK
ncbi:MAG: hypothetical protein K2H64_01215 [Desulfovibrio sp.]|nr:hypothetical protein [Desulfovibrio sp.]